MLAGITQEPITPSLQGDILPPIFAIGLFLLFCVAYALISLFHHKSVTIVLTGSVLAVAAAFLAQMLGVPQFSRDALPDFPLTPFSFESIFGHWINFEVIGVVFGMSLLIEASRDTGLFDYLAIRVIKNSRGNSFRLWLLVFFLTLFLSAILDNVTAIILIGSMTLLVCRALYLDPKPYLLTEAFACVVAGTTTLVSSLPSIIVGTEAHISFIVFSLVTLPSLFIILPISLIYLRFVFRKELKEPSHVDAIDSESIDFLDQWAVVADRRLFIIAVLVISTTVVGFIITNFGPGGQQIIPLAFVAIAGGTASLLFLTSDPIKVLKELHWDTILFFIGLFVMVGSLEQAGVLEFLTWLIAQPGLHFTFIQLPLLDGKSFNLLTIGIVVGAVAIFSAILDNIPLTAAMAPVVKHLVESGAYGSGGILWFSLLFGATFGGGFTPLGAAPSVIVMGTMREEGYSISFFQFMKLMAPLSAILLVIGVVYLLGLFFVLESFTIPV